MATKGVLKSQTMWGSVLTIVGVIGSAAVTGLEAHKEEIGAAIEALTPGWMDPMVGPALVTVLGLLVTLFGRQKAAESGKKLKGIF